jgi:hypothetical protein
MDNEKKRPMLLDENGNKIKKFFAIYDDPKNEDNICFYFVGANGENQYRELLEAQLSFISFMKAHPNLKALGQTMEDSWNKFFNGK